MAKFYITTPIYYPNDVPHIGHTGTTVFADIVARHHRLLSEEVFFLTGLDEHGQKVAGAAVKAGQEPQEFVDELAVKWQDYWKKLDLSNDEFFRTTSKGHKEVVSELLTKLWNEGKIYKATYKGIYCVGCEEFKAERDLIDGKCPEHRPDQIVTQEETNYFFKFSEYTHQIREMIVNDQIKISPQNKKNEMIAKIDEWIKDGNKDISCSRQTVSWGIPIPWDTEQTTYVWVEALMNYYSATKIYQNRSEYWPADVHFLGKGNNWFHSVIWPAFLLALGLPLPKNIYVHGYYNVEGKKMGKSLGNVISPQQLIDRYGSDGTRYLLCASMPYKEDSDVSFEWFDQKYNAELANGLGNLISRVGKLVEGKNYDIDFTKFNYSNLIEKNPEIKKAYEEYRLQDVVKEINKIVNDANEFLSRETPWKKEGEEKETVLKEAVQRIIEIGELLLPITPNTANQKILGVFTSTKYSVPEILFKRLV